MVRLSEAAEEIPVKPKRKPSRVDVAPEDEARVLREICLKSKDYPNVAAQTLLSGVSGNAFGKSQHKQKVSSGSGLMLGYQASESEH